MVGGAPNARSTRQRINPPMKFSSLLLNIGKVVVATTITSLPASAAASDFSWNVKVTNQRTKEQKIFAPDDSEMTFDIPGGYHCVLQKLKRQDHGPDYLESRVLFCKGSTFMSGTVGSCVKTRGMRYDANTAANLAIWTGFSSNGEHVVTVIVECRQLGGRQ